MTAACPWIALKLALLAPWVYAGASETGWAMGLLVTVGWTVAIALVAILGYGAACAILLSFVRFPDEGPAVVLEDVAFVATLPFVVVLVLLPAIRRG
jgi:hypothetical protein